MDWVGSFRIALRELKQLHRPSDEVASSIELIIVLLLIAGPPCLFYMSELLLFRIADSHGLSRTEHPAVMRRDLLSHLLLGLSRSMAKPRMAYIRVDCSPLPYA